MATSLAKTMKVVDSVYYNESFLHTLEDMIGYILRTGKYTTLTVDAGKALQFKGDLFGLFKDANVNMNSHYISMRLNDMANPTMFDGTMTSLKVIDYDFLVQTASVWKTQNKV